MPVDAFTGATRSAGAHRVALDSVLQSLPEGDYQLRVEAVREVGGRELLNLDFTWPINEAGTQTTEGSTELGTVTLHLNQ